MSFWCTELETFKYVAQLCVMMLQLFCLLSLHINIIISYFQLATWNRYLIFYYCVWIIQLAALLNFSIDVPR